MASHRGLASRYITLFVKPSFTHRQLPIAVSCSATIGTHLQLSRFFTPSRPAPTATEKNGNDDNDDEALKEARRWLSSFTPDSIPREYCEVSFSRSSGPGGQNVNKVSTKATLRFYLRKAKNYFPSLIMDRIKTDPIAGRYLTTHDELLIQSDSYRNQNGNKDDCFRKLYQTIVQAAALPGETSAEQRDHVSKLQRDENVRRIKMKKLHSNKKSSRKPKGDY